MTRESGLNYRRGLISLAVLTLLKEEEMYGYQLVQEMSRRSDGKLTTQEGSLYPVLYRLQEQGLIVDKKVLVGKRMTRVYYQLSPKGEAKLDKMTAEYLTVAEGMRILIHGAEPQEEA